MNEHAKRAKRRKVAAMLRRAIKARWATREDMMEVTGRGPRTVAYWLSGEVLPPPKVLKALEALCRI